jgi:hypothetical protein
MKTTRYFDEQVRRKRPYLMDDWLVTILATPLRRSVQPNGRIRWWGRGVDPRDGRERVRAW